MALLESLYIISFTVFSFRPHLVAAATNTGVVLLSADFGERPAVVALPAQVMTLEALMHASEAKEGQEDQKGVGKSGEKAGSSNAAPSVPSGKGAQGLTYVMAAQGKLWSTALRMESKVK